MYSLFIFPSGKIYTVKGSRDFANAEHIKQLFKKTICLSLLIPNIKIYKISCIMFIVYNHFCNSGEQCTN